MLWIFHSIECLRVENCEKMGRWGLVSRAPNIGRDSKRLEGERETGKLVNAKRGTGRQAV
jgi:hypothetical protein